MIEIVINKKLYNLKDLQQKLRVLKVNLTSFFILQEDLTVSILLGREYFGVFHKMIKTRNNLTRILINYDMSSLQEILDFLNKNIVLTKEKKNVKEKEIGDVIHLHLELSFLNIEIYYYKYLISIFLEKYNMQSDFEFSLDYIEIFLEKMYETKSENSVYFFSKILKEFKENIKQMEKNVKMLTTEEKFSFFSFQIKLWKNIADLRKISHEYNKKYAREFPKLIKEKMDSIKLNEIDNIFFELQKSYYENIYECLKEKQDRERAFENKREEYNDIAKKIEKQEEDYVIVFTNKENLAMLLEKLKIMRNVENFKKNINQFNRILILLKKPSLSFVDFNILKLKLEKNIEELNIIKKTKGIEDFLLHIIAKYKKDLYFF